MATIRSATEQDLAEILAIYNDAIEHSTAVFTYRPETLETRREWFRAKQTASLPVLVSDEAGSVTGFGTYGPFRAWPAYKYSIEHSVYVAETARGRGTGTALVKALLAEARARDIHTIVAGITADNAASLHLHRSLGFVEVGHIREVGYKFGKWLDLKFLQLTLDGPRTPTEA